MAVSSSDLFPRVRSLFNERPFVSTATLTSSADLIATVTDGGDWEEGAIMEFQDNGEQCLVQSISGNDVTVVRGWNGTTAQTHTSITVFRDPQYTYDNISRAVAAAVQDLWPHVWKAATTTVTPASSPWYEIPFAALGLISVNQEYGSNDDQLGIYGDGRYERQVIHERNVPTGISTTTTALRFPNGFYTTDNVVNVTYAAAVTGTTDIEDDTDLNVAEAVIYGAAARILAGKEAERVTLGEDVEEGRSIRVGGRLSAGAYYERLFQREKEMLNVKIKRQYPIMPTTRLK